MDSEASETWEKVLSRLGEHVSPRDRSCWLDSIRVCGLRSDVLVAEVPSAIHLERVREHFLDDVGRALTEVCGRPTTLELTVNAVHARRSAIERPESRHAVARYTFDTFVIGGSNEDAYRSALAVARAPGARFNPLFLYGGVGLGKTHLLSAIAHAVGERRPVGRVALVSAEGFTNDLIHAFRTDRLDAFRDRFRKLDLLIVDDVQFLAGKERMQEEFFHTFNALHAEGRQIVIASDQPPQEISNVAKRLTSRFASGLTAAVRPPELSLRRAIVTFKARALGLELAAETIELIAGGLSSNVREIEGALHRLLAASELAGRVPDLALAVRVLQPVLRDPAPLTVERVQRHVAECLRVGLEDLRGRGGGTARALPRQVAMYFARKRTRATYAEIAAGFGGRNHSTVLHAVRAIEERRNQEPAFARMLADVEEKLAEL
jgi:chromosomal replication initiator protein